MESVPLTLSGECFSSGESVAYSLEGLDGCLKMSVGLGSIRGWKHSHGAAMTPADEGGCQRDIWKQPGPRIPKENEFWKHEAMGGQVYQVMEEMQKGKKELNHCF